MRFGDILQVAQEFGDDVPIGHVAPKLTSVVSGQEIAPEEALQRAHEAASSTPLLALLQRLPPEDGRPLPAL
jgi:hypothetical protein